MLLLLNPANPEPARLFMRTKLFQTYTSTLFTRNLNMFMPAQINGESAV